MTMGEETPATSLVFSVMLRPILAKLERQNVEAAHTLRSGLLVADLNCPGIAHDLVMGLMRRVDPNLDINESMLRFQGVASDWDVMEFHSTRSENAFLELNRKSASLKRILSRIPDEITDRKTFLETIKEIASAIKKLLDAVNEVTGFIPGLAGRQALDQRKREFVKYSKRFSNTLKEYFKEGQANAVFIINGTMSGNNSSVKRGNVCVPVMIAHLNRYADELEVWGMPAGLVSFVAILTKVDAASTRIHYEFRDETGTIKGIKWINSEDAVGYACPVQINSYARVYGQALKQNDEAHVLVMNIQPLEHLMELLAHLMEVTVMCLEGNKAASNVNQHDTSLMHHQNDNIVENKANSHIPSGLNRDQGQVYSIIFEKSETEEYGIDRNEIKSKVSQSLISKVDDILDFLSAEGHVYTTITDDHFKVIS